MPTHALVQAAINANDVKQAYTSLKLYKEGGGVPRCAVKLTNMPIAFVNVNI